MAEIISVSDFTPERLLEAVDYVYEMEVNALVFRGMALSVHDKMLELHKQNYVPDGNNKFINDQYMVEQFVDLGWDIPGLRNQPTGNNSWPVDTEPSTTIEFIAPGKGLDWHNDVARGPEFNQLYLPLGIGVSTNLVSPALFRVSPKRSPLKLSTQLSQAQLDALADHASVKVTQSENASAIEAVLYPGDVIMWRQPVAHEVSVYDEEPMNLRRAVIFIEEDLVFAQR